ncbi:MAG: RNA polymerase sigma factor [Gammaproteobacteria bacterium]|nr:RNA polymerase sigma factor [Gammaproteobacteria bacterium]
MDERITRGDVETLEHEVDRARSGDRAALESVVRAVQKDIHNLAIRFLWHPQDAEDATQEILIRVLTGLGGFRGESGFRTWVYRVACNALLTLRKQRMEQQSLSFEQFGEDLAHGLSDASLSTKDDVIERLLLEEVKIGCTLAMLQCLDRDHRLAYILGEIMELEHVQAAGALETTPAAFRKRLSRARASIISFMTAHCGLINPANACRCHRRISTAVALGRVDPSHLLFATSQQKARRFPEVLAEIRQLEESRRAVALYRSHPEARTSDAFIAWLKKLLDEIPDRHLSEKAV